MIEKKEDSSGNEKVCKTFIQRFESAPRLQQLSDKSSENSDLAQSPNSTHSTVNSRDLTGSHGQKTDKRALAIVRAACKWVDFEDSGTIPDLHKFTRLQISLVSAVTRYQKALGVNGGVA